MQNNISTAIFGEGDSDFIPGPVFVDCCGHPKESYIGSFRVDRMSFGGVREERYDLYVYESDRGYQACIRYGEESYEYISPGMVLDLLLSAATHKTPEYRLAALMIVTKMKCEWTKA